MGVIDEVKSRLDIVDVIGQVVPLKRAGRSFKAPCPFHSERTPSFIVSPDRQSWHCFGACATGGDVIAFVMKRENLEFGEALRVLAQRAGVDMREQRRPEEDEEHHRLLEANEAAAAFFHNALLNSEAGATARAYLASRGLDAETIEAFQLGYSLESWDALKSHLKERGFSDQELLAAGLLVESDRGGYDRFRGRLMFPIRDDRGRVAGFGGRALGDGTDTGAKYINTPQTPMFDKGRLLYGLDRAKESIRQERVAVVVEGYMDAIAAHQHGRSNVVASMGTALTERQIRLLERLRCKVYLALDADAAGVEATLRALQEAGAAGAARGESVSIHPDEMGEEEFEEKNARWSAGALGRAVETYLFVPLSGKDPDEMIRNDPEAWEGALAQAKPFGEHIFALAASRRELSQPDERQRLLEDLLPVLRLMHEPVHLAHYVQRLGRLAQVREDVVRAELRRAASRPNRRGPVETRSPVERARRAPGEEFCLALLLQHQELRPEGMELPDKLFILAEHRAIFDTWRATRALDEVRAALPEELNSYVDQLLQRDLPLLDGARLHEALRDCVARIQSDRLRAAKQASAAALAELEADPSMTAAVAQALQLKEAQAGQAPVEASPPQADPRTTELATTLLQDEAIGKQLHGALAAGHPSAHPASPQEEDER